MPSTISGASNNPSSSSQKGHRRDYGRSQSVTERQGLVDYLEINKLVHSEAYHTVLPSNKADTATRSLNNCRSVKKQHEFLPDCKKIPGPFQHLKVTQWMASIDGKENPDALNSRMEEKQPSTTQESAKNSPIASSSNSNIKKQPQAQKKGRERHQPQILTARVTESQKFSRIPWKMYFRWPEQ
ncbi:hypothetical protein O181_058292 [Austropuccinia psidii MF-1]|uniref:Uncharacterized protein n=1 Tax=Austropuccinia psidii MF-1 TaxID=1389203 RepID=A0A9Q3HWA5_9BASI|nr:hypothetical protein [Austropuccinia psidii MF-1]